MAIQVSPTPSLSSSHIELLCDLANSLIEYHSYRLSGTRRFHAISLCPWSTSFPSVSETRDNYRRIYFYFISSLVSISKMYRYIMNSVELIYLIGDTPLPHKFWNCDESCNFEDYIPGCKFTVAVSYSVIYLGTSVTEQINLLRTVLNAFLSSSSLSSPDRSILPPENNNQ